MKINIIDTVKGGWISKLTLNGIGVHMEDSKVMERFQLNAEGALVEKKEIFSAKGGMIVFSTNVNATIADGKTFLEKVKVWMQRKVATLKNVVGKDAMVNKIIGKHPEAYAFTFGTFFRGRYRAANGQIFDEASLTVEIIGIQSDILHEIALDILREFRQEAVLVKDYQANEIYLEDGK